MADLSIKVINNPGQWRVVPGGTNPYFLVEIQEDEIPASGHTVTFSISPDDGNVLFGLWGTSDPTRVTGDNGRVGMTFKIGDRASGTYTATATSGTVSVSRTFTIGTPRPLSVSASLSNSSPNRGDTVTFTATVTENGSPVPGQALTFGVSRSRFTPPTDFEILPVAGTVSLSSTSATTDSNGQASISVSIGSGASDDYSVTARLSDGRFDSAYMSFEGSSPPPTEPDPPPTEPDPPDGPTGNVDDPPTEPDPPDGPTGNVDDPPTEPDPPDGPTGNIDDPPTEPDPPDGPTGNIDDPDGPTGNTPVTPPGTTDPVKRSDLVVSTPVVSKTVLDSGESFTLSVTVENTGEVLSPETILRYYRSSDVGVSGTEVGQKTVRSIAAMGSSNVSLSLTAPDALGTYLYYACVSSVTGESNTDNNCSPNSVSLTVQGEKPPDTSEPPDTSNKYDVNGDGAVDIEDAALVAGAFGTNTAKYDVNGDGSVDVVDLLLLITNRQEAAGAPSVVGMKFTAAQIDRIQAQIALLAATNNRPPAARQTLAYLRSLIAMARPEKTQLLANYPNPFNPETWIPYRLASAANVTLTIYDLNGQVVRALALGHQAVGIYQSRSRAAYWDGRNAFGEPVASGVYFYTLTAGDFTATRKMLIRK